MKLDSVFNVGSVRTVVAGSSSDNPKSYLKYNTYQMIDLYEILRQIKSGSRIPISNLEQKTRQLISLQICMHYLISRRGGQVRQNNSPTEMFQKLSADNQ